MTLKVPNRGEADLLKASLNVPAAQENLVLRLFRNDHVPADTDTEDNYTEASFVGYAAIALDANQWTVTEGNPTEASYPTQTFTSGGGGQSQEVYGYYVTGANTGRLKWAERFTDGPYEIVNLNDKIEIDPIFTGQSEG